MVESSSKNEGLFFLFLFFCIHARCVLFWARYTWYVEDNDDSSSNLKNSNNNRIFSAFVICILLFVDAMQGKANRLLT